MPGMNSGLSPADPTLVAAFRSALLHQGAVGALAVILIGAAPMASAAANRTADPILALAIAGTAPLSTSRLRASSSPTRTARRSRWPACAVRSC